MTTLQITDVKPGELQPLMEWSNSDQKRIEIDPREDFLMGLSDRKIIDWQTRETSQTLFHRDDNLPQAPDRVTAYHRNYVRYLMRCWSDHLGVVFTPDILWYSLLGELVQIVKGDVEEYRHIFTDSPDKKEIIIITEELVVMPLALLIEELSHAVPSDVDAFIPEFSTTSSRSRHAMYSMFADMCSPYYNYSMLMCNFPAIDIRGEQSDYEMIHGLWENLKNTFPAQAAYMNRVGGILKGIVQNLNNAGFWQQMFSLDKCGSGSDVLMRGWWSEIYREKPKVEYPDNFSSHIGKVSYKQLNTGCEYEMQDGLFFSRMKGDFLVPEFGFVVQEKIDGEK